MRQDLLLQIVVAERCQEWDSMRRDLDLGLDLLKLFRDKLAPQTDPYTITFP